MSIELSHVGNGIYVDVAAEGDRGRFVFIQRKPPRLSPPDAISFEESWKEPGAYLFIATLPAKPTSVRDLVDLRGAAPNRVILAWASGEAAQQVTLLRAGGGPRPKTRAPSASKPAQAGPHHRKRRLRVGRTLVEFDSATRASRTGDSITIAGPRAKPVVELSLDEQRLAHDARRRQQQAYRRAEWIGLAEGVVTLPLSGPDKGGLHIPVAVPSERVGLAFRLASPQCASVRMQLLEPRADLEATADFVPGDPAESTIPLPVDTLRTTLRTSTGCTVELEPRAASFLQLPAEGQPPMLMPVGPFSFDVAGGSQAPDYRLLVGTSSTEFVTVRPGDMVDFVPSQPAQARTGGEGAELTSEVTTSWVRLLRSPDDGGSETSDPISYSVQPPDVAFHARSNHDQLLEFHPVPTAAFPAAGIAFPIVPVAAPGHWERLATADQDCIGAVRRQIIEAGGQPVEAERILTVTPQGFVAALEGGAFADLSLAANEGTELRLSAVAAPFARALTSPGGFVVADEATGVGTLGSDTLSVSGWPLRLGWDGERSVLVMKLRRGVSLRDLSGTSQMWTTPEEFTSDVGGLETRLSNFVAVVDSASSNERNLYRKIAGVIDDPDWTGVLVIDSPVSLSAFPTQLKGLLGGMSLANFRVHHFGVTLNRVGAELSVEQSSIFGLIDYRDEDAPIAPTGYDFDVLTLRARFDNTRLVDFRSRIRIVLNAIFGEAPATDTRSVELVGSYEMQDDEPVYSFTYEGEREFHMPGSVVERLEVTRAQFATAETPGDDTSDVEATFTFWGELGFGKFGDLDVFSFDAIDYAGLELGLRFRIDGAVTEESEFFFRPERARLDQGRATARSGSLFEGMPLRTGRLAATPRAAGLAGYLPVSAIGLEGVNVLGTSTLTPDYALHGALPLGSGGSLRAAEELAVLDIVIAWEATTERVGMYLRLPGVGSAVAALRLLGPLQMTVRLPALRRLVSSEGDSVITLGLRQASLEFFGMPIPPGYTFELVLFADPSKVKSGEQTSAAWYVAFVKVPTEFSITVGDGGRAVDMGEPPAADEDGGNGEGDQKDGDENGEAKQPIDLELLAVGQQLGVKGVPEDVAGALDKMRAFTLPSDIDLDTWQGIEAAIADQLLELHVPTSGWAVGFDFTILEALHLAVVFVEPTPMGLLVELEAGPIKGFAFEILYARVTEDIGVYRIKLALPEELSQIEMGQVSITLPALALDIYTTGDFRVDIGFPKDLDFSNSASVQVLPFVGFGGLYFAKLSTGTATNLPTLPEGDRFELVLEGGIGLSVGLGKSFKKGVLSAGLTVTMVGIIEGTVAWYRPGVLRATDSRLAKYHQPALSRVPDYYRLRGTVALVGTVHGAVDFGIIKAGVYITLYAGVTLEFVAYEDLTIELFVGVKVAVEVKVWIFKVSFSFSTELRFTWAMPIGGEAPWEIATAPRTRALAATASSAYRPSLTWDPDPIFASKQPLELSVLAQETIADGDVASVVLLMVKTFEDDGFATLADRCVRWAIRSGLGSRRRVGRADMEELADLLDRADTTPARSDGAPLDFETILSFLENNFEIEIRRADRTSDESEVDAAVFPMLPWLSARPAGNKEAWRNYATRARRSGAYERDLSDYFRETVVGIPNTRTDRATAKHGKARSRSKSLVSILLEDYFAALIDALVERAIHTLEQQGPGKVSVKNLIELMQARPEGGGQSAFADAAGLATRLLLHGLRVPPRFPAKGTPPPPQSLYALAGQQFPVELANGEWWVQMRAAPSALISLSLPADEQYFRIEFDEAAIADLDRDVTISADLERPPAVGRSGESYVLDRSITWVDEYSVRPFPPNLLAALSAKDDLRVGVGEALANSHWVTRVELPIRRIPGIDGLVEAGGVSEAERTLLERLSVRSGVDVVYRRESGPVRASDVVLVKTNLATESAPQPSAPVEERIRQAALSPSAASETYTAAVDGDADAGAFVDLVRQLAVVKGSGFYLSIPTIPDALFDENGNATVTVLIDAGPIGSGAEIDDVVVPQGTNAVRTAIGEAEFVSFTAVNRYVWNPLLEPGTVAFDLVRPVPSENDYLQTLFHLAEHRVLRSKLKRWSVPVGPTEPEDAAQNGERSNRAASDAVWRYHHVVDAHVHKRGLNDTSKAGRYATVGSTVDIDVNFLDPFGNRAPHSTISNGPIELPILYTDRIIPISEWSGTRLVYRLNKRNRKLIVEIGFDPAVLADLKGVDNSELRAEVTRLYEKVLSQLHGRGVSVTLETSLTGAGSANAQLRDKLRAFVSAVLVAIESGARVKRPFSIAIATDADHVGRIQQVRVGVVIARDAKYVDDMAATKMPTSLSAATWAAPDLGAGGDPHAGLEEFARAFETIYPDVKVATGESDSGTLELWSVPLVCAEIKRSRVAPEFFAPRPLSTTLVNGAVTAPDGTSLSLVDVDLDEWAARFLADVDSALAPDQIGGWLDSDVALLEALLRHKRTIAEAIADGVATVLGEAPPAASLAAAHRSFRSRVRRRLGAASDVETVVWLRLRAPNITEPGFAPPRVYGTVVSTGAMGGSGITLSNAKMAMSKSSEVSFLFDTATPEQARSAMLELGFNITHLEHEIDRVDEDYGASAWLTLVLPEIGVPLGDPIEVPVPLRRYPVPPALVRQSTEPSHGKPTTLAQAASWDYRLAYRSAASAQDTLGVHVQFNDRGATHSAPEPGEPQSLEGSLAGALARYLTQFAEGFDASRRADFVQRVGEVADAWPVPHEDPMVGGLVPADFVTYDVVETKRTGDKPAHIMSVTQVDGLELDRVVTIDEKLPRHVDGDQLVFMRPKGSWSQRVREFELAGLDVRVHENARAHLVIRRNEDLVDDRDTNPLFVYRTPVVRFEDEVTPLLESSRSLPMSKEKRRIGDHLRDFFDELLDPVAEETMRPISLGVVYRYDIDRRGQRRMVVPLIQTPAFEFDQTRDFDGDEAFTTRLAAWLSHWQSTQQPGGKHARFEFDVRVFAALSEDVELPVLRLGRLELPLDQIL